MYKLKFTITIIFCIFIFFPSCNSSSTSKDQSNNVIIHKTNTQKTHQIFTSVTYSKNENENIASEELLSKLPHDLNPNFMILYSSPDYDIDIILKNIRNKYPTSTLFGTSTYDEILTNDGIIKGKKGAIALLASSISNYNGSSFAKAFPENSTSKDIREIAQATVLEAIKNSDNTLDKKPKLIYISCNAGYEEESLNSISELFNNDVKIYGATSSTSSQILNQNQKSFVISNNNYYTKGISVLLIYDGANIGGSYKSGFLNFSKEKSGIVTSCDTRSISSINNKPATEVYNDWTSNLFSNTLLEGKIITNLKTQYLFTRKLGNSEENILTAVIKIDPIDKKLGLASNLNLGQEIHYIEANSNTIINRTGPMINQALVDGNIKKSNMFFGIFDICSGARRYLGNNTTEVVDKINEEFDKTPWIGLVSQGEQGTFKGYGSFHGNFMSSIIIFGN